MKPSIQFLAVVAVSACALSASAQIRTIDTPVAALRLSEENCDLIGLHWKSPELEVIGEARLGENFRILIPQKGYEANYFNSRDQKVSQIDAIPGGVLCTYDALQNDRETLPVKVRYRIEARGGQLHFSIAVDNPTDRKMAEVMYGIIGGQQGIGDRLDTESMVPGWQRQSFAGSLFALSRGDIGGGNFGIPYDAGALHLSRRDADGLDGCL